MWHLQLYMGTGRSHPAPAGRLDARERVAILADHQLEAAGLDAGRGREDEDVRVGRKLVDDGTEAARPQLHRLKAGVCDVSGRRVSQSHVEQLIGIAQTTRRTGS